MSALSVDPPRTREGDRLADDPPASGPPVAPGGIHLDVDVRDHAVARGCPAHVSGGLPARELRARRRGIVREPHLTRSDAVEVDATAHTDTRARRLAALCVLELLAGLAERR